MSVDVRVCATTDGEVKIDFMSGPVLGSVILAVEDEEPVLNLIRRGFSDARRVKAGESVEDIASKNEKLLPPL